MLKIVPRISEKAIANIWRLVHDPKFVDFIDGLLAHVSLTENALKLREDISPVVHNGLSDNSAPKHARSNRGVLGDIFSGKKVVITGTFKNVSCGDGITMTVSRQQIEDAVSELGMPCQLLPY